MACQLAPARPRKLARASFLPARWQAGSKLGSFVGSWISSPKVWQFPARWQANNRESYADGGIVNDYIPPLIMTEGGVIRRGITNDGLGGTSGGLDAGDILTRMQWHYDIRTTMETYGIGVCYYEAVGDFGMFFGSTYGTATVNSYKSSTQKIHNHGSWSNFDFRMVGPLFTDTNRPTELLN